MYVCIYIYTYIHTSNSLRKFSGPPGQFLQLLLRFHFPGAPCPPGLQPETPNPNTYNPDPKDQNRKPTLNPKPLKCTGDGPPREAERVPSQREG